MKMGLNMSKRFSKFITLLVIAFVFLLQSGVNAQEDHTFYSKTFKTERWYRIFLPKDYNKVSNKRYPVIFFFHGWGGRYKWSAYPTDFDEKLRDTKRKEPPFVEEWRTYTQTHDVIIVCWDGNEPLYQPGKREREGIKYDSCVPYDFKRVHEKNRKLRGWDFRLYFRDLVAHIDSTYRTIPDRAHRGVTGLSMGGLMSVYVGGQNKDYVSSVSAFCPADNIPLFGPLGKQVVFPVLEMWRSLEGVPVRLTATTGDWLFYNDMEMKRLWENSLSNYNFHLANFPDHWAGDAHKQLDYHMEQFSKNLGVPQRWNYVLPGYPEFKLYGYSVSVERSKPTLTLFEHYSKGLMKVLSRNYIPDGKIETDEVIHITTDLPYSSSFRITAYNLSTGKIEELQGGKADNNNLKYDLSGGGHLVNISGSGLGEKPVVRLVEQYNRDYHYFESGKNYQLNFKAVNLGLKKADKVEIRAFSDHPYIVFTDSIYTINNLSGGSVSQIKKMFNFSINNYNLENEVGNIKLQIEVNGAVADTQKVIFFSTPKSLYINKSDIIVLDGREVKDVPVYRQGKDVIVKTTLKGGTGNGNGIMEKGESVLIFIRLAQGMAPGDTNTFHRTYLLNSYDDPYISIDHIQYDEKIRQASATSLSTVLKIAADTPQFHQFDLWFKVESLFNEKTKKAWRPVYAHKYDYRRIKIEIGK